MFGLRAAIITLRGLESTSKSMVGFVAGVARCASSASYSLGPQNTLTSG